MADAVDIKYEALNVEDVTTHAEKDSAILILNTDQGRIALHMKRALFERLEHEIRQALERED